jgi:hypothetical protein
METVMKNLIVENLSKKQMRAFKNMLLDIFPAIKGKTPEEIKKKYKKGDFICIPSKKNKICFQMTYYSFLSSYKNPQQSKIVEYTLKENGYIDKDDYLPFYLLFNNDTETVDYGVFGQDMRKYETIISEIESNK